MPDRALRGGGDPAREGRVLHEQDVIDRLVKAGARVSDQQKAVQLPVLGNRIVGHIDGWIELIGPGRVLEVKAIGKTPFKQMQAKGLVDWVASKKDYAMQLSGAMIALDAGASYAVKSRDSGEIVTQDIDDLFYTMVQMEERMALIEEWVDKTGFPKCEHSGFCWNGPYRHVHYKEGKEEKEPTPFRQVKSQAIENLAERLYDVRRKRRAAEELEGDIKQELLGMIEPGDYETERLVVRVSEVESKRLDTKTVREEHGDKYDVPTKYSKIDVEPKS